MIASYIRNVAQTVVLAACLGGCETVPDLESILGAGSQAGLSSSTIAAGLREALAVGSARAVDSVGVQDGFLKSAFRIPLPDQLQQAKELAGRFGLAGMFEDLEVRLNRAAEAAAPRAKTLFVQAVKDMTFTDVMAIYQGPDDAATQYLQRTTAKQLTAQMRPMVDESLATVGAVSTFKTLAARYNALPLVEPVDADISGHVLSYTSNALFTQLAKEESAIRNEPIKRTTELLRRVFGQ